MHQLKDRDCQNEWKLASIDLYLQKHYFYQIPLIVNIEKSWSSLTSILMSAGHSFTEVPRQAEIQFCQVFG